MESTSRARTGIKIEVSSVTPKNLWQKSVARNHFSRVHRIHSNCLKIRDMVVEKGNTTPFWRIFPSIATIWKSLASLTFWLLWALARGRWEKARSSAACCGQCILAPWQRDPPQKNIRVVYLLFMDSFFPAHYLAMYRNNSSSRTSEYIDRYSFLMWDMYLLLKDRTFLPCDVRLQPTKRVRFQFGPSSWGIAIAAIVLASLSLRPREVSWMFLDQQKRHNGVFSHENAETSGGQDECTWKCFKFSKLCWPPPLQLLAIESNLLKHTVILSRNRTTASEKIPFQTDNQVF